MVAVLLLAVVSGSTIAGLPRGTHIRLTAPREIQIPGVLEGTSARWRAMKPVVSRSARFVTVDMGVAGQLTILVPGEKLIGTFVSLDSEALTIVPDGSSDSCRVSRASIERVEISHNSHRIKRGALIGFGVEAATGALTGALLGKKGCIEIHDSKDCAILGAVIFGSAGAGIGALIGSSLGKSWQEAPLQVVFQTHGRKGSAVALRFSF